MEARPRGRPLGATVYSRSQPTGGRMHATTILAALVALGVIAHAVIVVRYMLRRSKGN